MNRVTNTTVRMIARVTVAGDAVRIRLDNTFGTSPLSIGRAYVGSAYSGGRARAGLESAGASSPSAPSVVVPAGGTVTSDPVSMKVLAQQDLAVSLYVPDADVRPSQHTNAQVTSYLAANGAGDLAADETRNALHGTTTSTFWVKAIDVSSAVIDRRDRGVRRFDHRRHVLDNRCARPLGGSAGRAPRPGRRRLGEGRTLIRPSSTKASAATRSRARTCSRRLTVRLVSSGSSATF